MREEENDQKYLRGIQLFRVFLVLLELSVQLASYPLEQEPMAHSELWCNLSDRNLIWNEPQTFFHEGCFSKNHKIQALPSS